MRVFMLGWEFPPFISGGLGTACYGLTKALSAEGVGVTFVLPKTIDGEYDDEHVRVLSPQAPSAAYGDRSPEAVAATFTPDPTTFVPPAPKDAFAGVTFKAVPSRMPSPYAADGGGVAAEGYENLQGISFVGPQAPPSPLAAPQFDSPASNGEPNNRDDAQPQPPTAVGISYDGDLVAEARRYADLCVDLARGEDFDVIHAHDWLTFPAGMAVAAHTGKPLIVHVHATEFDRAGESPHQQIYDIERRGVHAALKVIAVSRRTRDVLVSRYGLDPSRITVVYNGVENGTPNPDLPVPLPRIEKTDKVVLFLGRVTMQKGPDYFLRAAKRVLDVEDHVKFVVAGSGDQLTESIETVARLGIGHRVLFTGFLRGKDVDKVLDMADVYVMPSVSEPFGIAPLEAIRSGVPVIMSKQSGVAEVIDHALKVDFWDTDEMANMIVSVLRRPPLGATMRQHASVELRRLTWSGAAEKCVAAYADAVKAVGG
ncbi:MAG: glycosyltransferase [Planctomycetota bacterium]